MEFFEFIKNYLRDKFPDGVPQSIRLEIEPEFLDDQSLVWVFRLHFTDEQGRWGYCYQYIADEILEQAVSPLEIIRHNLDILFAKIGTGYAQI